MRVALLTEGGYPYVHGADSGWCERLLHGLGSHEFEVYALSRSRRQQDGGRVPLPSNVVRVREAPLWDGAEDAPRAAAMPYGRRLRRRFRSEFGAFTAALCTRDDDLGASAAQGRGDERSAEDRFTNGLYGLAELAAEHGGLPAALRSEDALRTLEASCRTNAAPRAVQAAQVPDLLAVAARLERALRPLSLDWYGDDVQPGLAGVDLVHAVGGGPAVLPGLLAKRRFGTPLLLTEYGVRLREHYLRGDGQDVRALAEARAPVRAILAAFQRRLVREAYAAADVITPGNAHTRRWQERCGADAEKLRTVYPGMDAAPYAAVGEATVQVGGGAPAVLTWVGRLTPAKDVVTLLHALVRVRERVPGAKLRIVADPGSDPAYATHCRTVAAGLFPAEAAGYARIGEATVTFEGAVFAGGEEAQEPRGEAFAGAGPVVLSSVVEGFPIPLVEAMFSGRATVATDVGAVCEVVGGTGLVVPPRNPPALAEACAALLLDPERQARLGAAARARALELFTVEQNVTAFRGLYLELISHRGEPSPAVQPDGAPQPFAVPAEARVPAGRLGAALASPAVPAWARATETGRVALAERVAPGEEEER